MSRNRVPRLRSACRSPLPPAPPAGFHAALQPEDVVDLRYEEGWWDARIQSIETAADGRREFVLAVLATCILPNGPVLRRAREAQLRPLWKYGYKGKY